MIRDEIAKLSFFAHPTLPYPTTEPNAIAQAHRMRSHKRGS
ncbi:hypothetical protein BJP36_39010 [Moorena producens JHB]|uniref:Uncharacterized protein n=1 Tax=Moorena producens (strain JHB) TaxID=1454205 RepID=A0A9Q9SUT5_MOOP1|nr:hypothetical protein [Moorena producens]WAN70057.1 hypothetical protein BJP36_39010 [Moorena producens JHB]